ncbi:MAG: citrate/2-methylcitrate synthase [Ruminococcus sp.]|nr:citrate/2-methylcitrate synthase [Ruminococcus sp.]
MGKYSDLTPEILKLSEICIKNGVIDPKLYEYYDVKRGLRDADGKGVLTGLTEISEVTSVTHKNGERVPIPGKLYYRGYNIEDLVKGFIHDEHYGFEEISYLLLTGNLPTNDEFEKFNNLLGYYRTLPDSFVRDIIMKAPSRNIMNALSREVLTLYCYDEKAEDTSTPNVLRQCIQLIALLPVLAVYSYQAFNYFHNKQSLFIHSPNPDLSTAENILHMLRPDCKYSKLEAKLLDMALVLHAEHGGGNNSTFTTHVVTSSGTDTYSAIAAALCSLKGPKHGGANIKVVKMFRYIKKNITDYNDKDQIRAVLTKILDKEAFDKTGLIYGMGHAIYTISDPRARVFKRFVKSLSEEKGRTAEYRLYSNVEEIAAELITKRRRTDKPISANVDFYSGFVYSMLDLPTKLFTPLFAIARVSGWSAHRIEELVNPSKIIRPAYRNVREHRYYVPMSGRKPQE